MYHQLGVRHQTHQLAGTASVVEVDVGEEDVVHILRPQTLGGQGFQYEGHGGVDAGIDDCPVAVFDDEVDGVEALAKKSGVERADAVLVVYEVNGHDEEVSRGNGNFRR